MKYELPPHIAWPVFIVLLLGMSVSAAVYTFVAANSDGGPQVVSSYHETSAAQARTMQRRQQTEVLGLRFKAHVSPRMPTGLRTVELIATERDGRPATGLTGEVTASRPQRAAAVATQPFAERTPGHYYADMPLSGAGLWDFRIDGTHRGVAFETVVRTELRP